jgi:hypothetical protein
MNLKQAAIAAVFVAGLSADAAAQSAAPRSAATVASSPGVVATAVDVSRLPIDIRRIERQFRQTTIREERDGLNLRYFVDVYAKAPEIVLLTPEDNLRWGPVPYGAPTHREMVDMITPQEHRAPAANLGNLFRLLSGKKEN